MKITLNVKLGLAAGLINCIAWYAFAKSLGYYSPAAYIYKLIGMLILLLSGVFVSVYAERKANGGFIDFRNALKVGVLYSLVFAAVMACFNYIYYTYIATDAIEYFVSEERKAGLAQGHPLDEVNKHINDYVLPTFGSWHAMMNTFLWGLIFSLIIGGILRKKRDVVPFSEN